jgi:hypothetical protein
MAGEEHGYGHHQVSFTIGCEVEKLFSLICSYHHHEFEKQTEPKHKEVQFETRLLGF